MDDDLAASVFAGFERRWKAFEERLNRSLGQKAYHALKDMKARADAARAAIGRAA